MMPLSSEVASPAAAPKFAAEAFSGALTKRPAAKARVSITLLITRFSTVGGHDASHMPLRTLIRNFRLQLPGTEFVRSRAGAVRKQHQRSNTGYWAGGLSRLAAG